MNVAELTVTIAIFIF